VTTLPDPKYYSEYDGKSENELGVMRVEIKDKR
jgi:hypothetical protein